MNKTIYDAVSGINENYLEIADDVSKIKNDFRKSKTDKIKIASVFCFLIVAAAVFSFIKFAPGEVTYTAPTENEAVIGAKKDKTVLCEFSPFIPASSIYGGMDYDVDTDDYIGDSIREVTVETDGMIYHQLAEDDYEKFGIGKEAYDSDLGDFIGKIVEIKENGEKSNVMSPEPSLAGASVYYFTRYTGKAAVIVKSDNNCSVFTVSTLIANSSFKEIFEFYGAKDASDIKDISFTLSEPDGAVYKKTAQKTITDTETINNIVDLLFGLDPEDVQGKTPEWFTNAMEDFKSGKTGKKEEQITICVRFTNGLMIDNILYLPYIGNGYIDCMKELTTDQNDLLRSLLK